MGIGRMVGRAIAPATMRVAPTVGSGLVRSMLGRAVDGVGALPGAATSADRALRTARGEESAAVTALLDSHVRLAGAQGFVTNIGGAITSAVTIPANIAGLALVQCHLVAGIAHLRGYPLHDSRTRNAVLVCLLGSRTIDDLLAAGRLPADPRGIATSVTLDPDVDALISTLVTTDLIGKVGGKRLLTSVARRVPVLGGAVGGGADGLSTWQIGRYAANALPRRDPEPIRTVIDG